MIVMSGNIRHHAKPSRPGPLLALTVAAALAGIIGFWASGESADSGRFYLRNSGGAVLFEHDRHVEMSDGCVACHHTLLLSDERQDCADCHGDEVAAEDFEHSDFMQIDAHTCQTCHQADDSRQAGSCRDCHPDAQESDQAIVACGECHDDDYTADALGHDEMQEIHGQSCEGCHNARPVGSVYHEQCNRCHFNENREVFATRDGSARCERCHLK